MNAVSGCRLSTARRLPCRAAWLLLDYGDQFIGGLVQFQGCITMSKAGQVDRGKVARVIHRHGYQA